MTLKILTIVETEHIRIHIVILIAGFHLINSVSAVVISNYLFNKYQYKIEWNHKY